MPSTVDELIALLQLDQLDDHTFVGEDTDPALRLFQRVFGGQVLAQALMAAYHTVEGERIAHSLSAYFLRPGEPGVPISYTVDRARDGGSFSTRRVVAKQQEREIFSMACSFHEPEPGLEHSDEVPAGVPDPRDCPALAEVLAGRSRRAAEAWQQEWGGVDARFASDASALEAVEHRDAAMKVWVKANGDLPDDPRIHQAMLAYLSDLTLLAVSTVPHPVAVLAPGTLLASINHSMWFHRPVRADRWLLYDEVSPSASKGLGFSFGRLFSGPVLAASCAQEGLVRLVDQPSAG